jgi:deazaflavin-dependent oxidoreductase (nitroreductase family)
VHDSPTSWVKQHIDRYVATDGREGHMWEGAPCLLLTTIGRKSGEARRTALIYGRDGEDYILVASQGGLPQHPSWFLNLEANPEVEVQVLADVFRAKATTVDDAERAVLWPRMAEIWPDYNDYQTKTERQIPVVRLTRI